MRLLLTGGSGFVGRRLAALALRDGHNVTALSRDPQAAERAAPGVRWLAADLAQPGDLGPRLAAAKPDAVIHLAALIKGTAEQLAAVNVEATAALLAALRKLPAPPRFVYVSSFAVEDTPPTPYSESKLAAEEVVRAGKLPFVILRPALVYGPNDAGNTLPLVAKLRAGSMWLPAGGRTRIQPVFVDDVARACLEAASRPAAVGHSYRLGGPQPVAVRDFRLAVRDATGGKVRLRTIPLPLFALMARGFQFLGRPGPLGVLSFHRADHAVDSSEAQRDLGFAPRPLDVGLRETFAS